MDEKAYFALCQNFLSDCRVGVFVSSYKNRDRPALRAGAPSLVQCCPTFDNVKKNDPFFIIFFALSEFHLSTSILCWVGGWGAHCKQIPSLRANVTARFSNSSLLRLFSLGFGWVGLS